LTDKAFAYLIWGVRNSDHAIVGTKFAPRSARVGNEELENWLLRKLFPKVNLHFFEVEIDERQIVILEIGRATSHPVQYQGDEYIRVGSYKKRLKDFPEKERLL
jgi:predicted HTH transcriptional regulator